MGIRLQILLISLAALSYHQYQIINPLLVEWVPDNDIDFTKINNYICSTAPGFENLGKMPGSEDIEISKKHKLAFVTVGLRYPMGEMESYNMKIEEHEPKFKGIYVYDLKEETLNEPIKLEFDDVSPHGISLIDVDDKVIRVAFNSHARGFHYENPGEEELIIFDYDIKLKEVIFTSRIPIKSETVFVNDIAWRSESSLYLSNDHGYARFEPEGSFFNTLLFNLEFILPIPQKCKVQYLELEKDLKLIKSIKTVYDGGRMGNGVLIQDGYLVMAETLGTVVNRFRILDNGDLDKINDLKFDTVLDNLSVDENGDLLLSGITNAPKHISVRKSDDPKTPKGYVIKLKPDLSEYVVIHTHADKGISTAATWNNENSMLIGAPDFPLEYCTKS